MVIDKNKGLRYVNRIVFMMAWIMEQMAQVTMDIKKVIISKLIANQETM